MTIRLFKIKHGPWTNVFSGELQGYEVGLYSNSQKQILALILDKEKGKTKGAIVQMHAPFLTEGNLYEFVKNSPQNLIVFSKKEDNSIKKFLLMSSQAQYIEWHEKDMIKATNELYAELSSAEPVFEKLARNYSVKGIPLSKASDEDQDAFFQQPLIPGMLLTSTKGELGVPTETQTSRVSSQVQRPSKTISGEILLGTTRGNEQAIEPLSSFKEVIIAGGDNNTRQHLMHVLLEGMMFANISPTVIDLEGKFDNLSIPTGKLKELKDNKVDTEPLGFPIKKFELGKDAKIDLNLMNAKGLMEIIGIGNEKLIKFVEKKLTEKKHESLDELIEHLKASQTSQEINQYQINKLIRVFNLTKKIFGENTFGENPINSITTASVRSLGRTGLIDLVKVKEPRLRLMLVYSLVKGILEKFKAEGKSQDLKTIIVLPEAHDYVGKEGNLILQNELKDLLIECSDYGVGYILESSHPNDLKDDIKTDASCKLNIVTGLDVAVDLEGQAQYRVKFRPTLSKQIQEE